MSAVCASVAFRTSFLEKKNIDTQSEMGKKRNKIAVTTL
jgi:hypothetical protein